MSQKKYRPTSAALWFRHLDTLRTRKPYFCASSARPNAGGPHMKLKIIKFFKDFLLWSGILRLFAGFNHLFFFLRNFNLLRSWISRTNRTNLLINDFYSWKRDYPKRLKLFETVSAYYELEKKELLYLEFGVASGSSFFWWMKKNTHPGSVFRGFDTFEGLPEDWGGFKKGAMAFNQVEANDDRAEFIRGIFQESLHPFIESNKELLLNKPKVIHLDADLFSSTIFVLSQLFPYLKKGDIIFFDEFNVANHEFLAFKIFTESFYVKLRPIGAVNNFYQTAFVVDG